MKRATTSLHRTFAQSAQLDQSRGYSEAAALVRQRQWTRPAETTTPSDNATKPNDTPPSNASGSGAPQLKRVSWGPLPPPPRNDQPASGPGAQKRGQAWPELPGFGSAPTRNSDQNNRRRHAQGPKRAEEPKPQPAPKREGLRAQTEAHILFQQRTSQRQAGSPPWQGIVPPFRSWAVSVPTPGLQDEAGHSSQRPKRKDRTARGSALEHIQTGSEMDYEETEIHQAAQKKKEQKVKLIEVQDTSRDVYIPSAISVSNLSRLLNVRIGRLQDKMYAAGMNQTTYDHILTSDDASLLALELGFNPVVDEDAAFDIYPE
ncbi:translation initiation factor eIF-2B beta subunit [Ceratobasidium sp. AG-Ba]|nr:translation initiation factor eIF-2B beta subunit [Ceratobasidium sp. AG-Ba]